PIGRDSHDADGGHAETAHEAHEPVGLAPVVLAPSLLDIRPTDADPNVGGAEPLDELRQTPRLRACVFAPVRDSAVVAPDRIDAVEHATHRPRLEAGQTRETGKPAVLAGHDHLSRTLCGELRKDPKTAGAETGKR